VRFPCIIMSSSIGAKSDPATAGIITIDFHDGAVPALHTRSPARAE
jgi:hypothetical protein